MNVVDALSKTELFSGLDDQELVAVAALCDTVTYPAGELIFREDSEGTELFVLPSGRVSVEIRINAGDETESIVKLRSHEIFGELALLDGHRRSASIRALEDTVLLVLTRDALLELLGTQTRIGFVVMQNLSKILATRLRETNMNLRNVISQHKQLLQSLSFRMH